MGGILVVQAGVALGPRFRRWVDRLSGTLGIPPEVALGVPKATMIGSLQVQIENHRGLVEYTTERVRVRAESGEIVILGTRLRIGSIYQQEMVIEGNITSVGIQKAGEEP